ncbi:cytokine receptor, partial [Asbolus verrucosus]
MCVLDNNATRSPNASRFLTFSRNNETIPSEMIEIVNSTAIKLHIDRPPKVSGDSYTCLMNNSAVCMNLVSVGTKPQPIDDFRCVSHNFDNLTCSWTAPENYIKTDYSLKYTLGGRSSRYSYQCPSIQRSKVKNTMSCFWNISTTPHYRQVHNEYFFTLKMKNKFGENQTDSTFVHFAHVLSGPPENLTALSTTPSSIYLYWMVPLSMQTFPPGVHHRILYQCEYDEKKWRFGGELTDKPTSAERFFNLTNLKHAHALCDIRISLRSSKALADDESMWSRNASITVRTSSKVPDKPPKTDVGSYEIVASGNSLQYREAYIYWQQILEEQKNGPDFRYNVRVEENPSIQPIELTNAYARFLNLSISSSYTFNIWSHNANGSSIHKSTVVIPKQTDRVKEPQSFAKVEFGSGRYELTWEAPKLPLGQRITNYTVFWCSNERDRPYQCNGKLNWTVVPATATVYNATVAKDKIFQFAISTNTETGSSGMLWAACTIIHNKNMGKMKNVWINRLGSTFIEVGWKLDCSDRIGSVEGFIVYYCPIMSPLNTDCKGPQKNETFSGDGSILSGNITNLSPYTTYMLTVAVITKHTTFSQQSDPLYNTTLEAAPSSAPQDFRVINVTNSSISLAWKPPTAMNGVLKYYKIEYSNRDRIIGLQVDFKTNYTILVKLRNHLWIVAMILLLRLFGLNLLNLTAEMNIILLYKHCKIMRDVEVKLPPGLAPVVADHTLVAWNTEKHQENCDFRSPPDEELLLVKMNEGRHLSGDSSGCSSGHESVTSSLESGTHISTSDSGTEQPGSYCVLGVDPKADSSYVPVAADSNTVPYKTVDVSNESSPYVMTGDAVKTINPGYIPFNQTEPIGKSS